MNLPPNITDTREQDQMLQRLLKFKHGLMINRIICMEMAFFHIIIFTWKVKRIKKEKVWGFLSSSQ